MEKSGKDFSYETQRFSCLVILLITTSGEVAQARNGQDMFRLVLGES